MLTRHADTACAPQEMSRGLARAEFELKALNERAASQTSIIAQLEDKLIAMQALSPLFCSPAAGPRPLPAPSPPPPGSAPQPICRGPPRQPLRHSWGRAGPVRTRANPCEPRLPASARRARLHLLGISCEFLCFLRRLVSAASV